MAGSKLMAGLSRENVATTFRVSSAAIQAVILGLLGWMALQGVDIRDTVRALPYQLKTIEFRLHTMEVRQDRLETREDTRGLQP